MAIDPRAATGFAGTADVYDRGRPSYPPEAIEAIARLARLTTASSVLDLAAGTGKLTRLLLPLAGRVCAVDPSKSMLETLRRQLPEVDARPGTAERIPVGDGAFDAVFVAEAFHWFRVPEACREIARVLVPGGALVLMWNQPRWAVGEPPWLDEFRELVEPHRAAAGDPPAAGDAWKQPLSESQLFSPLSSSVFENVQQLGPDEFVALVASWSWIANLPGDTRSALLGRVRDLVSGQSRLTLHYLTEVQSARRR